MASKQEATNSFTREEDVIHIGGIDTLMNQLNGYDIEDLKDGMIANALLARKG